MNDLVLKGGRIVDPSQGLDKVTDIAFAGGKVAAIGDGLSGKDTRDVAGKIVSPGLIEGGWLADLHSAYHENVSPALSWTARLEAEAFALIVEDPDAPMPEPFLHWAIWNIPGTATGLPQGVSGERHPPEVHGAVQGRNGSGGVGWFGPRPPEGHGVHRYHFQLFALDARLPDDPDTAPGELLNMLKGHTLVAGELVGLYERRDGPEAPPRNRGAASYA